MTILCTQFSVSDPKKRKGQAKALAHIYDNLLCSGREHIVICGTLYEPIFSDALQPLLQATDLADISKHPGFHVPVDSEKGASYHLLGAYRKGVNLKQQDYLMYSNSLAGAIVGGGMDRRGIWPSHKAKWPLFPTLKQRSDSASEHPLIWMDLELG